MWLCQLKYVIQYHSIIMCQLDTTIITVKYEYDVVETHDETEQNHENLNNLRLTYKRDMRTILREL